MRREVSSTARVAHLTAEAAAVGADAFAELLVDERHEVIAAPNDAFIGYVHDSQRVAVKADEQQRVAVSAVRGAHHRGPLGVLEIDHANCGRLHVSERGRR